MHACDTHTIKSKQFYDELRDKIHCSYSYSAPIYFHGIIGLIFYSF